jgi:hypothetical protein
VAAAGRRGGGEPFQPRATGQSQRHACACPRGATLHRNTESQRQWGGGGCKRGQGGGRGEEGRVEEVGVWEASVEADPVRVEEDPEHHHPQRPHRHLWYAHLVWSHPGQLVYAHFHFSIDVAAVHRGGSTQGPSTRAQGKKLSPTPAFSSFDPLFLLAT